MGYYAAARPCGSASIPGRSTPCATQGYWSSSAEGCTDLAELPPLGAPDLVAATRKVPAGVVCLISALAFHELTTQIPHAVYIALARGVTPPRLDYPPVRIFWFTGDAFTRGIEIHTLDHVSVRIYTADKTLADCFKYRHKLGPDVAVEALKLYRQQRRMRLDELLRFARICRVEKVMRPYLVFDSWDHLMDFMIWGLEFESQCDTS